MAEYLNPSLGIDVDNLRHEVQYRDIIKKPDYFQDATDFLHYQMCTKAKAWEHEQEVRMFILDPSPEHMNLPYEPDENEIIRKEPRFYLKIGGECFESIYLGVNIDKKEKEKIIKVARDLNPDIKIYQMEIDTNAFRLDANQLS